MEHPWNFLERLDADLSLLELEAKISSHSPLYELYASVFKDKGSDFAEVRPYRYGDDVRCIDWRVSARRGEPHVRVDRYLPPKKNRQHLWEILSTCLQENPKLESSDLKGALHFLNQLKSRQSIIIISDFAGENWHQEMNILSLRHDILPVLILDPRKTHLQGGGNFSLQCPSGEQQTNANLSNLDLQQRFKPQREKNLRQLRTYFSLNNIDLLVHHTHESFMDNLFEFFHHRNQSGRRLCQIP